MKKVKIIVYYIYSVLKYFPLTLKIKKLRKIKSTNIAHILANGPSLIKSLEKVKNIKWDIFCVNRFADTEYFEIIKPKYYVLADPAFRRKNPDKDKEKDIDTFYSNLIKKVKWKIFLFISIEALGSYNINKIRKESKNIEIIPYMWNPINISIFAVKRLLLKLNLWIPSGINVLIVSIFLSLQLWYKKTYIYWADHSRHLNMKVDDSNNVLLNDMHFYDKKESSYKKTLYFQKRLNMGFWFQALATAFKAYDFLEKYSKSLNAKIYNASEESFIDAFERRKPG